MVQAIARIRRGHVIGRGRLDHGEDRIDDGDALHLRGHALQLAPLLVQLLAPCSRRVAEEDVLPIPKAVAPFLEADRHLQPDLEPRRRGQQLIQHVATRVRCFVNLGCGRSFRSARDGESAQRGRVDQVRQHHVDALHAREAQRLKPKRIEQTESSTAVTTARASRFHLKALQFEAAQLAQRGDRTEAHKLADAKAHVSQPQRLQLRLLADGVDQRRGNGLEERTRETQIRQRGHGWQPAPIRRGVRQPALERVQRGQRRQ